MDIFIQKKKKKKKHFEELKRVFECKCKILTRLKAL